MIQYILGGLGAALGYYLFQSEADYKRGLSLLAKNPDDATGNLVVGAYLGSIGKWDEALPYLAKSNNKDVADAVVKDQAGAPGGKYDQLEVGDLWATAATKVGKYKKQFNDRALFWYAKCWPDLDGAFKDKLRTRLKQIQLKPGTTVPITQMQGWPEAAGKTFSSGQYAVLGNKSLRIDFDKKVAIGYLTPKDQPAPAGKDYVFSGWILSDGTDTIGEHLQLDILAQGSQLIDQKKLSIQPDTPVWTFLSIKGTFPTNAIAFRVTCIFESKVGSAWYDGVSLVVDGKELIKNGSFE